MSKKPLILFILSAGAAMLAALWAGLIRLGWTLPVLSTNLASAHGPLMVSGFLGTLVTLERAVALRKRWMYAAPALTGGGSLALLAFPENGLGYILLTLGSLLGVGILVEIVRRETQLHSLTMLVGSVSWFLGNLAWSLGQPIFQVVWTWQAFLVLTIAGERLELSRVLRPTRMVKALFVAAGFIYLLGVGTAQFNLEWGARAGGLGMILLAAWLIKYDLALRNLRHRIPLTRYIATCLSIGFVWLGVSGLLNLYAGATNGGPLYDAALHGVFVGFVISMIFGHAPIIFPAILGVPIQYKEIFYLHLALLHVSLFIRLAGDLAGSLAARQWGGLLNEAALILFVAMTIVSLRQAKSKNPAATLR